MDDLYFYCIHSEHEPYFITGYTWSEELAREYANEDIIDCNIDNEKLTLEIHKFQHEEMIE